MPISLVLLIGSFVVIGGLIAAARPSAADRAAVFQGLFRSDADLGWPHGVQEADGDRAWVPRADPPTLSQDDDRAPDPVPVVRVIRA